MSRFASVEQKRSFLYFILQVFRGKETVYTEKWYEFSASINSSNHRIYMNLSPITLPLVETLIRGRSMLFKSCCEIE